MSDLTLLEKRQLEKWLDMGTGYVAGFSNHEFADFVLDTTGCNIYDSRYNYGSGSKANRLRAFWKKEDNQTVGKLMEQMLACCFDSTKLGEALQEDCRRIVARLLGSPFTPEVPIATSNKESETQLRTRTLKHLQEEFLNLAHAIDRNAAGLALEKLLNRLFEVFDLQPR